MDLKFKPKVSVALVRSKYPSNMGSSARACANLGAEKLFFVSPLSPLDMEAKKGAAGANYFLENSITVSQLSDIDEYLPNAIKIAFSRRGGKKRISQPTTQLIDFINSATKHQKISHIVLVYGPEDHGLDSDEIESCQFATHFPQWGTFQSFNLSQAVLLGLYIFQEYLNSAEASISQENLASPRELETISCSVKNWLESVGFNLESRRVNAHFIINKMIFRSLPTKKEFSTLQKALQQTIRKLTER